MIQTLRRSEILSRCDRGPGFSWLYRSSVKVREGGGRWHLEYTRRFRAHRILLNRGRLGVLGKMRFYFCEGRGKTEGWTNGLDAFGGIGAEEFDRQQLPLRYGGRGILVSALSF